MEIERQEFRETATYILLTFRKFEEELLAHQVVLRWMRRTTGLDGELEQLLQLARSSPVLVTHIQRKYDEPLEYLATLLAGEFGIDNAHRALRFLRELEPSDPPIQ